jgi:hypothetical protein
LSGLPMGESWPLSPVSLFMWSGHTAAILQQSLMTGDTRAVLSTVAAPTNVNGLPVIPTGVSAAAVARLTQRKYPAVLHDVLTRVIGFTTCQGHLEAAALTLKRDPSNPSGWHVTPFIEQVQRWLVSEKRLIELHSGSPLVRALFVRTHKNRATGF